MLEVKDLRVEIQGVAILRGISFEVPKGGIVGLVGRNGAGKTTTLRSIMGLIKAESRQVSLDGVDLLARRAYDRASLGIGYMPEDRRLVPHLTVADNLRIPLLANRVRDADQRLQTVFERLPLVSEFRNRPANLLSGGQQKLVALARALVIGRRLLLLDEPFEGLAPALADATAEAIKQARAEEGLGVLLVESEQRLVQRLAETILILERGEIVEEAESHV